MKKSLFELSIFVALILFSAAVFATTTEKDYTKYVDTRVGTASRFEFSRGNTYPATGRPFGMHLWSPQTGYNNNGWKYVWFADEMRGFCLSHQCSPWTRDYASFSLFPEIGEPVLSDKERGAKFSHDDEIAMPHYYRVAFKNGIVTEMTPTERCCYFRFEFPADKGKARILVDECRSGAVIEVDKENSTVRGWVGSGRRRIEDRLKNYFIIRFDCPFDDVLKWEEGVCLSFPAGSTVQVQVGTSYISPEQAVVNLERELGEDKNFDETRLKGQKVWNELLSRIDVEGGTEEEIKTFYTCLYHANLFSRKFYEIDANGQPVYFSPYDFKQHNGYMFNDNGFWDSFRSQFPLTNILHPTMQGRYMQALLDAYEQMGWLPSWSFLGEDGGMIGNHAISLLADAWAKGIRTFDPAKALDAYVHEVSGKGHFGLSNGRAGYQEYWEKGYVSYPGTDYSSAMTLEYAYDDFCGYLLAEQVGNEKYKELFGKSMYNYRNVFDENVGFMRGRDADGGWTPDFRPGAWGGPFIEGNAWHYNWSVFHDIQGLINLYGGNDAFVAKLDSVFSTPGIIDLGFYDDVYNEMVEMVVANMGQYEHGNQPIQHMPYLYNYAGQPWKTQYHVREIMRRLYNSGPEGYPGDEDQGAMSAWYVLSALGIYAVTPGTTQYVIGSPVFRKATLTTEDGKKFVVEAPANSQENVYIQSATLNGKPLENNYIDYSDIVNGSVLRFEMGPEPAYDRCITKSSVPFSISSAKY